MGAGDDWQCIRPGSTNSIVCPLFSTVLSWNSTLQIAFFTCVPNLKTGNKMFLLDSDAEDEVKTDYQYVGAWESASGCSESHRRWRGSSLRSWKLNEAILSQEVLLVWCWMNDSHMAKPGGGGHRWRRFCCSFLWSWWHSETLDAVERIVGYWFYEAEKWIRITHRNKDTMNNMKPGITNWEFKENEIE